jgi:hypothetical protein
MKKDLMEITLSKENYKILHKLICDQVDAIHEQYNDDENYVPTLEHMKVLSAVTQFSAYQVTYNV